MVERLTMEVVGWLGPAFVAGVWQGIVLIAVVGIGLRMMPRVGARVRFVVWGLAFVVMGILPLVGHSAGHGDGAAVRVSMVWGLGVVALWVALSVVRAGQLVVEAVRVRGVWRRAVPVVVSDGVKAMLDDGRRRTELCVSAEVDAPSVIGFFAPRLLLPVGLLEQVSEVELQQVVLHECEHLRRGDDWMNLVQKIGLAVFPLNPALVWMDRRLGLERELACDAGVVAKTDAPVEYAHCLTRLAERRMGYRRVALALSAWSKQSELSRRVTSLLKPMRTMKAWQGRVVAGVLGVVVMGGAVEMAKAPEWVAFKNVAVEPMEQAVVVSPVAMKAVPVVFHEEAPVRKVVVKAAVRRARIVPQMRAEVVSERVEEQEPRESLAEQVETDQDRLPVAVPVVSRTYAAVPFGDGWLIIQL